MLILIFGGIFFLDDWINTMKLRTARVNQVGAEMTDVLINQMNLYSVRVHEFYRLKTDEARASANARWFSRAELDMKNTFTYEEAREKWKTIGFDSVDRSLTGLARIERFDVSVLEEGRTYDENDFLVVCQVLLEIEMEDGAWLLPLWNTGWGENQQQTGITKIWRRNGIAITIPMQIEGSGKNFWVDGQVDGLP
jgi:hypothetical protein